MFEIILSKLVKIDSAITQQSITSKIANISTVCAFHLNDNKFHTLAGQTCRSHFQKSFCFLIATLPARFKTKENWRKNGKCTSRTKRNLGALNCNTFYPKKRIKKLEAKAQHWQWAARGGVVTLMGAAFRLKQRWVSNNTRDGESLLSLDTVSRQKQQPWHFVWSWLISEDGKIARWDMLSELTFFFPRFFSWN